jgi:hypothetical protein
MLKDSLKTLAATSPKKFRFYSIKDADAEITRLEQALAAKNASPAPAPVAVADEAMVNQIIRAAVAEVKAERAATPAAVAPAPAAPGLTGKALWDASVRRDAAAQAKPAQHANLSGRQRFLAGSQTSPIPAASAAPPASGLKGRARFNAGVAKDFSQK